MRMKSYTVHEADQMAVFIRWIFFTCEDHDLPGDPDLDKTKLSILTMGTHPDIDVYQEIAAYKFKMSEWL